jgi:hypothetical protein
VGEGARIRQWFHDQYRDLLLETARQLVIAYKSHPELHSDPDFRDNLENGFENWHDGAASLWDGADGYLSRDETRDFLKQAGRSERYITAFLKNKKTQLPLILSHYRR